MDQQKIGRFLKSLRREKGLTQEALAERLGVTGRSVSRWENASSLPELSLLMELADFYGVELREILDGERMQKNMDKKIEETARKVADYSDWEKDRLRQRIHLLFAFAVLCFLVYMGLELFGLADAGKTEIAANLALGFVFGMVLVGTLFTSRLYPAIRRWKKKLLRR